MSMISELVNNIDDNLISKTFHFNLGLRKISRFFLLVIISVGYSIDRSIFSY